MRPRFTWTVRKGALLAQLGWLSLIFASCIDAANDELVVGPAVSAAEFRNAQEKYCSNVAELLNAPIDWHVVLDVSGSYSSPDQGIPESLVYLIRSLPLRKADSIWVDTFSAGYSAGRGKLELTTEWIEVLQAGSVIGRNQVESALGPRERKQPLGKTDIAGLIPLLAASRHPHAPGARIYYVVLTDGMHEPQGEGQPQPLFREGDRETEFLKRLNDFVGTSSDQRSRALFLVVDPGNIKEPKKRVAVRSDWLYGLSRITDLEDTRAATAAPPLHGVLWDSADTNLFSPEMGRRLGRIAGVFPCLISGNDLVSEGRGPTVTGSAYEVTDESLPFSPLGPFRVALEKDILYERESQAILPIIFLVSQTTQRDVLITLREGASREGAGTVLRNPRVETVTSGYKRLFWKSVEHDFEVPVAEADLARHNFPWALELQFQDREEQAPFLRIDLLAPEVGVCHALTEAIARYSLSKRVAILALVCFALSSLFSWWYAERIKVSVDVRMAGNTSSPIETEELKDIYGRRQLRFRQEKEEIREVLRENWPDPEWLKSNKVLFDVIPVLGVVYHLVYYFDPGKTIEARERCDQISFREDNDGTNDMNNVVGLFYRARTFWRPHRPGQGKFNIPFFPCHCEWVEWIALPEQLRGEEGAIYKVVTRMLEKWWLCLVRWVAAVLSVLAFAFSGTAALHSFGAHWRAPLVAFFVVGAVSYCWRCWPRRRPDELKPDDVKPVGKRYRWLWVDSTWTFLLYAMVTYALYSAFSEADVGWRVAILVLISLGLLFSVPLYEKMRDQWVKSRIANRQPVNAWDFLLEIFLARLPS